MKKLIENYWKSVYIGVTTQDASKITANFATGATYKFRLSNEFMDLAIKDMAGGCLEYKDTLDDKYSIDRIDELKDGTWMSVITSSVGKKPYFVTSYFRFDGDKIVDLIEYYGDFGA
ncbi:MAG: hypothetical protein FWE13_00920 [Firmicutes bacterium]|nr:hypothetical protein [Bacillota bacterium]